MAARKTAEEKAAEAQAAEEQKAAEEQAAAQADDQPRDADGNVIEPPAENDGEGDDESTPEPERTGETIPAAAASAPPVENADAIAEAASPASVTSDDGLAAFRPPQTQHQAWQINTLAESEGGSKLGVEQTSGNADVTKNPADRDDEAE